MYSNFLHRILIVACVSFFTNSNVYSQNKIEKDAIPWIDFQWSADSLNGRFVEKTAMKVEVKIDNMPYLFDAQFDLGAVSTMVYGNTFAPYLAQNPFLQASIDTGKTIYIEGVSCPYLKNIHLNIGGVNFEKQDIALFTGYGEMMTEDSMRTSTVKHIGSIAADLFKDKILVIDYVNQRLCSIDNLPVSWQSNVDFVDMEHISDMNWILIPVKINGVLRKVLFDTGSSLFSFISSPTKIAEIANTAHCVDSITVSSWGVIETVRAYTPANPMIMGKIELPSLAVYASENLEDESLDGAGFWGILGNRYFLDKMIIIDYKNKKFGISK